MDLDEAIAHTIEALRNGQGRAYGYDLYPAHIAQNVARRAGHRDDYERTALEWSPLFFDAAWELCRRGILRPGITRINEQAVTEGGYSITSIGAGLLEQIDEAALVVLQPGSLAATLAGFHDQFGDGFHQRSQEAIRCRDAGAWLACCAMVGAAAESILLAVAITKTGDEEAILKEYGSAMGRSRILNLIIGKAPARIQRTMTVFSNIVALWRDDAAHGVASDLGAANADEALRQLLHMCQWVEREWGELVS